ncbi:MAG: aminoglycoside phosphotransferase family protein [Candidatus Tectomicrobia bacterium]|nr:aminoglycoside phosphotransferase family protein [Candidatus Tectomicrobia bacterium]
MTVISQLPGNESQFAAGCELLRQPGTLPGVQATRVEVIGEVCRPYSRLRKIRITTPQRRLQAYMKQYLLKEPGEAHAAMMRERVAKDYQVTSTVCARFEAACPGLHVQRPLACFPDLRIVVFEESPGDNFQAFIRRHAYGWPARCRLTQLLEYAERCGEWLRCLQQLFPGEAPFVPEEMWIYIDQRLQRLIAAPESPLDETMREQIHGYFEHLTAQSKNPDLRTSATHADFFPGNILVDPTGVTVLDLAMFTQSSVYHDVAQFYHQLELLRLKPIFRPGAIRQLQQAFLRGYDPDFDPWNPMFAAFQLQHVTTHLHRLYRLRDLPLHERWYNRRVSGYHYRWIEQTVTC